MGIPKTSAFSLISVPKNLFRRKNLLIYPKFQLTIIGANFVVVFLLLGLFALQTQRAWQHLHDVGVSLKLGPTHPYFHFIDVQFETIHNYFLMSAGVGLVFSGIFALFISHRLVGPIVRLTSYLKEVGDKGMGESRPLKFRKNDYFEEIPSVVNQALAKVVETASDRKVTKGK